MADTVATVTALIRSIVQDTVNAGAGQFYTDAYLIPFLASAYRSVQKKLASRGVKTVETTVVIVLPATGTQILDGGVGPQAAMPADFVFPYKLEERRSGSTDPFAEISERSWGLPDRAVLTTTLDYWRYQDDILKFTGASVDREVRLTYEKRLATLTAAGNNILIRDAIEILAFFTLALVARGRGKPKMAEDMDRAGFDELREWIKNYKRHRQRRAVRRRPFSARATGIPGPWPGA